MRESCTYGSVRGASSNGGPYRDRREFIGLLGGSAIAWPLRAPAQQSDRIRRIGVLMSFASNDPEGLARVAAFERGLRELGWVEGRNLRIEYRWADNANVLRSHATGLIRSNPDLILANSTPVMAALQEQPHAVPIVFTQVTDPDPTARELISHQLQTEGFSVVTAAGGLEGLKRAKEMRPMAITLDVMMPDLDGWSVLATLRQEPQMAETPVIMVTIVDEHRRGIALGAAGYLTKPIDRERLTTLVQRFRAPARQTRVLVVEDDPIQRERVRTWLEAQQWLVTEAANGKEALTCLRNEMADLILLDLMMPEMDGFQLVTALQKEPLWR